jgi:hypothetical protein
LATTAWAATAWECSAAAEGTARTTAAAGASPWAAAEAPRYLPPSATEANVWPLPRVFIDLDEED